MVACWTRGTRRERILKHRLSPIERNRGKDGASLIHEIPRASRVLDQQGTIDGVDCTRIRSRRERNGWISKIFKERISVKRLELEHDPSSRRAMIYERSDSITPLINLPPGVDRFPIHHKCPLSRWQRWLFHGRSPVGRFVREDAPERCRQSTAN